MKDKKVSRLLASARRREILRIVNERKSVTVQEVADILGVSLSTVRNDFNLLGREGLIYRTHGGALTKEKFNPEYQKSISEFSYAKSKIAKKALEFVEPNDTIFIDSGSTALAFAEELMVSHISCHVITNSLYIVNALINAENLTLHVIGGEFRKRTMNFIDPEPDLGKYGIFKAFIGVSVFDEKGFYVSNLFEARFKKIVIDVSQNVFMLADASKYGKISTALIDEWRERYTLITDKRVKISGRIIIA